MFVLSVVFDLHVSVFHYDWKVKYLHSNLRFYMTGQACVFVSNVVFDFCVSLSLKTKVSSSQSTFLHDASNACFS